LDCEKLNQGDKMKKTLVINPGTGDVPGATVENAVANMPYFVKDCRVKGLKYLRASEYDIGCRFGFLLYRGTRCHTIEMPGLPLRQVRCMASYQNPLYYPRLYVDGASWHWKHALFSEKDFSEPRR